jgi:hypothetical protein
MPAFAQKGEKGGKLYLCGKNILLKTCQGKDREAGDSNGTKGATKKVTGA